ncbi:MAG: hypothetical protein ORN98_09045, partial [Alphaproteobacteria bacterium]|nr:hypothetical protein [Alphaproteobacteria bacterium]
APATGEKITVANNNFTGDHTKDTSYILTADLVAALASNNVTVDATRTRALETDATGTGTGRITVTDAISWSGTGDLTLKAGAGGILINANITSTNATKRNLILNSDGVITQRVTVTGANPVTGTVITVNDLTVTAKGAIGLYGENDFTNLAGLTQTTAASSTATISVKNTGAINITGLVTWNSKGALTLTAGGNIAVNAGIISTATQSARGGTDSFNNIFFADASLATSNGTITQTAAIKVGQLALTSTVGNLILNHEDNLIQLLGVVSFESGKDFSLNTITNLQLINGITTTGNVNLKVGGCIGNDIGSYVTANTLTFEMNYAALRTKVVNGVVIDTSNYAGGEFYINVDHLGTSTFHTHPGRSAADDQALGLQLYHKKPFTITGVVDTQNGYLTIKNALWNDAMLPGATIGTIETTDNGKVVADRLNIYDYGVMILSTSVNEVQRVKTYGRNFTLTNDKKFKLSGSIEVGAGTVS